MKTRGNLSQILRFGAVGGIATLIHAVAAASYIAALGTTASAVGANLAGFCASFVWSFLGNAIWVFRYPGRLGDAFPRFLVLSAVGLAISLGISAVTDSMGASPLVALALVVALVPTASYLCNRYWVFSTRPGSTSIPPLT